MIFQLNTAGSPASEVFRKQLVAALQWIRGLLVNTSKQHPARRRSVNHDKNT